jgi:hypothetical protein
MIEGWLKQVHHGDFHVMPILDEKVHFFPQCWCNPEVKWTEGIFTYSHHALDDREVNCGL